MDWKSAYDLVKQCRLKGADDCAWHLLMKSAARSYDATLKEIAVQIEEMRYIDTTNYSDARRAMAKSRLALAVDSLEHLQNSGYELGRETWVAIRKVGKSVPVYDCVYHLACAIVGGKAAIHLPAVPPTLRPVEADSKKPSVTPLAELSKLVFSEDEWCPNFRNIYRGVRSIKFGSVTPDLRNLVGLGIADQNNEVAARTNRLCAFRTHLRAFAQYEHYLGKPNQCHSEFFELAFAQHFKADDEARLAPPMLDFTYDPLVALFFASLGGETGEVGEILRLSIDNDFGKFSDFEPLGKLAFIDLPAVSRLRRQRGLLLHSPTPGAIEVLVPFGVQFNQVSGLVFEDRDLGIFKDNLLAIEDDIKQLTVTFNSSTVTGKVDSSVDVSATAITVPMLVEFARRRFDGQILERDRTTFGDAITSLAKFHCRLASDHDFKPYHYSLRTLIDACRKLADGGGKFDVLLIYRFACPEELQERMTDYLLTAFS